MSAGEQTPPSVAVANPFAPEASQRSVLTLRRLRLPELEVAAYGCSLPGPDAEERFAADLLDALAGADAHWGSRVRWSSLSVRRSPLGQPLLFVDGMPGPAISLGRASGLLWGAVSAGPGVGIDVALRDEFVGPYPYHRVFGYRELALAMGCLGADLPLAAAGIWAIKEAAVKAVGTGFHGFDPRDMQVLHLEPGADGFLSHVQMDSACPVWLSREGAGWLAVAFVPYGSAAQVSARNISKRYSGRPLAGIQVPLRRLPNPGQKYAGMT